MILIFRRMIRVRPGFGMVRDNLVSIPSGSCIKCLRHPALALPQVMICISPENASRSATTGKLLANAATKKVLSGFFWAKARKKAMLRVTNSTSWALSPKGSDPLRRGQKPV